MNKRIFDGIVLVTLLLHPAIGLLKMAGRRWSSDYTGPLEAVGDFTQVAL